MSHAFIRKPVDHALALAPAFDQPGSAEDLELGRGVGEVHPACSGELVDTPICLGKQLKQLDPLGVGDRLAEAAELGVKRVFRLPSSHGNILTSF